MQNEPANSGKCVCEAGAQRADSLPGFGVFPEPLSSENAASVALAKEDEQIVKIFHKKYARVYYNIVVKFSKLFVFRWPYLGICSIQLFCALERAEKGEILEWSSTPFSPEDP